MNACIDVQYLNGLMKDFKNNTNVENDIKRKEERISEYNERLNTYLDYVKNYYKEIRKTRNEISTLKSITKEVCDFTTDLTSLIEHKMVENIRVSGKTLLIDTDYIDISDNRGNKFRGNKYRLEFDYENMKCLIYGQDSDYCKRGYWTDEDPHPHVDGDSGRACWGDAGSMLSMNMNEYEIYASFIVVLNFLQQVNVDDSAGAYIRNWDCINEDDDVISNPYHVEMITCHICEYEVEEGNDNMYYCEDCGRHMCSDCYTYVESVGEPVCNRCIENSYYYCVECNELHHDDNLTTCERCEESFCEEHITEINGDYYCNECIKEVTTECSKCNTRHMNDEVFYCEECQKWYCEGCKDPIDVGEVTICSNCYNEQVVNCNECGDDVFKSDSFECEICNQWYCENCREKIDEGGEVMCDVCQGELARQEDLSIEY